MNAISFLNNYELSPPAYTDIVSDSVNKNKNDLIATRKATKIHKRIMYIVGVVLCGILAMVIVYGASKQNNFIFAARLMLINFQAPCSFTKCNSKASICINRPFYAQCVCDWGYAGNGKEYCEGTSFDSLNFFFLLKSFL